MTDYAQTTDLLNRYGTRELTQVTDRAMPPAGTYNTQTVQNALDDASAEIDSYLALRYVVPLNPIPPRINAICCEMARYKLHADRATPAITQAYKDAVIWLQALAAGRATMPNVAAPLPPATDDGTNFDGAAVRAPAPVFTGDTLALMP